MYLPGEHKVLLSGMDAYSQKIVMGMVLGAACCESPSNTFVVTQRAISEFSDKCKNAKPVLALQGSLDSDVTMELLWQ
ncbi:MAG: hypothetical protein EBR82_84870 [Caulobacteraceae bacterium]|jgi:hypothetical protein|nr:hypothetical protein [Caulobacteraceae bacterium]